MKKVLVATTNVGKIEIYKPIFKELGIDIVSLKDFNFENVPEEYGRNVIENAVIKAKY
jgi:inosine/xanthosine triphosphate pyrophosphatase family protein